MADLHQLIESCQIQLDTARNRLSAGNPDNAQTALEGIASEIAQTLNPAPPEAPAATKQDGDARTTG